MNEYNVKLKAYDCDDREWLIRAHIEHYVDAMRFDNSFISSVTTGLDMLEGMIQQQASHYVIAQSEDRNVGSIFLSEEGVNEGRIRLFYLIPSVRGMGIGKYLLQNVISHSSRMKLDAIYVSTYDLHPEACGLYERMGFTTCCDKEVRAYGHTMRQIKYKLNL